MFKASGLLAMRASTYALGGAGAYFAASVEVTSRRAMKTARGLYIFIICLDCNACKKFNRRKRAIKQSAI